MPGAATLAPMPQMVVSANPLEKGFAFGDRQDRKCELCKELGRTIAVNHDYKDSWANPNNPDYRPNIYVACLLEL